MTVRAAPWVAAGVLALASCVHAAPAEQPPSWAALTPAQQSALAPLKRDWAGIDSARKQKWIEVAARFPAMGAAERDRVQDRMAAWTRMTPAERGNARLQFQEMRQEMQQFTPEDKQARWEAYKALPDDERRALAQRAQPAARAASGAASAPATRAAATAAAGSAADTAPKRNVLPVPTAREAALKTIAPTVVQSRSGATTTLLTKKQDVPTHQQPGLPKIAATSGFVNPNTLLPKLGPQGAAVSAAASAPPSSARR